MKAEQFHDLATLRAVVGFLGEKDQAGWWSSSFFARDSTAFLAPVFGRTQTLAQCTAVTRAAGLVHDDRIGVGSVYHLFRLPEDMEQRIHTALYEPVVAGMISKAVSNEEQAREFLHTQGGEAPSPTVGPTHVGDLTDLRSFRHWRKVAALYLGGVKGRAEIFPYFAHRA